MPLSTHSSRPSCSGCSPACGPLFVPCHCGLRCSAVRQLAFPHILRLLSILSRPPERECHTPFYAKVFSGTGCLLELRRFFQRRAQLPVSGDQTVCLRAKQQGSGLGKSFRRAGPASRLQRHPQRIRAEGLQSLASDAPSTGPGPNREELLISRFNPAFSVQELPFGIIVRECGLLHVPQTNVSGLFGIHPILLFQIRSTDVADDFQLPAALVSSQTSRQHHSIVTLSPCVQVKLMMIHQVPLLPNVEVQVPYSSIIPLPRGGKISSLEKLVALFSKLVRFFEPL